MLTKVPTPYQQWWNNNFESTELKVTDLREHPKNVLRRQTAKLTRSAQCAYLARTFDLLP